jgi:hypothetical protein
VPRLTTLVTVRSCSSLVLPTATTCKGQSFEQKLSKIEEQFLQLTVKVSFENFERGLPRIVVRRLQNAVAKVPNRIRLPERELESRRQEFFGGGLVGRRHRRPDRQCVDGLRRLAGLLLSGLALDHQRLAFSQGVNCFLEQTTPGKVLWRRSATTGTAAARHGRSDHHRYGRNAS